MSPESPSVYLLVLNLTEGSRELPELAAYLADGYHIAATTSITYQIVYTLVRQRVSGLG